MFLPTMVTVRTTQRGWVACGKTPGCATPLYSKAQVATSPEKVSDNIPS